MSRQGFDSASSDMNFFAASSYHQIFASGTTRYAPLQGGQYPFTTEADAQSLMKEKLTFTRLYVRVTSNTCITGSSVTFRKNSIDGNLTVTIPAATIGEFESTAILKDSVVDGDLVDWKVITGTGALEIDVIACDVSGAKSFVGAGCNEAPITIAFNKLGLMHFGGKSARTLTTDIAADEVDFEWKFGAPTVVSNLRVYVQTNTCNGDTLVRTRKNGANGSSLITIPAGVTGWFVATGTDSYGMGDKGCLVSDTTASTAGSIQINNYMADFASNSRPTMAAWSWGITWLAADMPANTAIEGIVCTMNAVPIKVRHPFTIKNMQTFMDMNTLDAPVVVTIRINGVNGNSTITIPVGGNGVFYDGGHSDSVVPGDTLEYLWTTTATPGTKGYLGMIGFDQYAPPRSSLPCGNQNLLLSLPFREATGTVLTQDVAKPHHPVTLVHAPVWTTLASNLQVLDFDGVNDYMQCLAASCVDLDFTVGDFSLAFWVYPDDLSGTGIILGRYELNVSGWECYIGTASYMTLRANHGGVPARTAASGNGITESAWQLLGISRSGAYPLMYRNGIPLPMVYDPGGITNPVTSPQDLVIGVRYTKNANYFNGKLWNPRIWGRKLEPWEHLQMFNRERHLFGV